MNIYHIGRQQLTLILRSKWLISFGLLFVLLAFFVTYFSQSGSSGFEGFNRMTASLLNLNLLMIPLISLLMGSLFLAGEKEDSGLLLLLTYPISFWAVILGKYLGLFVSVGTVLSIGYGVSLLSMYLVNSYISLLVIAKFYILSLLLAAIFISLAMVIGVRAKTRFQALGISLILWAMAVLFYEFLIMGISSFLPTTAILTLLTSTVFLNPIEIVRVWSILALDGASIFGPSLYELTVWANGWKGQVIFILTSALWVVLPILISSFYIRKGVEND